MRSLGIVLMKAYRRGPCGVAWFCYEQWGTYIIQNRKTTTVLPPRPCCRLENDHQQTENKQGGGGQRLLNWVAYLHMHGDCA